METPWIILFASSAVGFGLTLMWALHLLQTIFFQKLDLTVLKLLCTLMALASSFGVSSVALYYRQEQEIQKHEEIWPQVTLCLFMISISVCHLVYDMKVRNLSIQLCLCIDPQYFYKLRCKKLSEALYYVLLTTSVMLPILTLILVAKIDKKLAAWSYGAWLLTLLGSQMFLIGAYRRIKFQLHSLNQAMRSQQVMLQLVSSSLLILAGIWLIINNSVTFIIVIVYLVVLSSFVRLIQWHQIITMALSIKKANEHNVSLLERTLEEDSAVVD